MKTRIFFVTFAAFLSILVVEKALANCGTPPSYTESVDDGDFRITVCFRRSTGEGQCDEGAVMLRQDASTGETVILSNFCIEHGSTSCFVDECVPTGLYYYGLEEMEWDCTEPNDPSADCNDAFARLTATSILSPPGQCTLSDGNTGAQPYGEAYPWGEDPDFLLPFCESSDDLDCSVANVGSGTIFSFNILFFAVGLTAFFLLRKKK